MAEAVQKFIESTVPELKDFEKQNIFSKTEIKEIVKKRTDFEYAVRRRQVKKIDFLRYIEYEQSLDKLRKIRKKRLNIKNASSISNYSIKARIHHIFDRLLYKYPQDIPVWIEYLKYARSEKSTVKMGKIVTRAVQMNPRAVEIWIAGASFEWDTKGTPSSARAFFQSGLRFNSDSLALWLEYFKMELLFISKILERKRLLNISSDTLQVDDKVEEEDDNVEDKVDNVEGGGNEEGGKIDREELAKEGEKLLISGVVVKIVADNAVKALGKHIVKDLEKVIRQVEDAYPESMTETCHQIRAYLQQTFTTTPESFNTIETERINSQ